MFVVEQRQASLREIVDPGCRFAIVRFDSRTLAAHPLSTQLGGRPSVVSRASSSALAA